MAEHKKENPMTIFSKMSDIVSANINNLLEKASDPVKMSKLMIQEMQETLVEIKASVAKVLADRKGLERQLEEKQAKKSYFEEKAQMAVDKGSDDLAKKILDEIIEIEGHIVELETRHKQISDVVDDYRADIEKLESKLGEARHKAKLHEEQLKAAKSKKEVQDKFYSSKAQSAFQRADELEQQIDKLDAESEAMSMGSEPSLEDQIAELEHEGEIKSRLEAMKKKAKKK